MSVTAVSHYCKGHTGSRNNDGKRQYLVVYKVDVDTVNDQTAVICDYFQNAGNLPRLGDVYAFRNDYDPSAVLTSISPKRTDNSQTQWEVSLTYETPEGDKDDNQQDKDPNGNLTKDPLQWVPHIDIGYTTIQIPVEGAKYISGFKGSAAFLCPGGTITPMINSAFIPFVPPPEKDFHISVVRRQWYDTQFIQDVANAYIGRINAVTYMGTVLGYSFTWPEFTAKIVNIGGTLELINNGLYWHNQVEVHINPLTWLRQIADRGLHRRMMPGDPDGRGGFISSSDLVDDVPVVGRVIGADDLPVVEPVLFDGDGQPLITDPSFPSPVWLTYQVEDAVAFPDGLMGF